MLGVLRVRVLLCLLGALAGLSACSASSTAGGGAGASTDQVKSDINATSLSDPASLRRLAEDAHSASAADAARQVLTSSPSDSATWAAVYVYAATGGDPAPLHALLGAKQLDVRAMAAAGCVADGDAAGFPVLIDLMGQSGSIRGSMPPLPLWLFSATSLVRVTGDASMGPPSDAQPAQVAAAQKRWQSWWSTNSARLRFDKDQALWGIS